MKKNEAIIILTPIILLLAFFSVKSTDNLPVIKLDTSDYIPGLMIVNISEDTWVGNNLLPGSCQWTPCSSGENFCEKNCNYSHSGCANVDLDKIWVGKGSGSGTSGNCGKYDTEKHGYFWFNTSAGNTGLGNHTDVPWYLIQNATLKLYVTNTSNCQGIDLRPVLPNENKQNASDTIHRLVYTNHYYASGDYYAENSTFFGSVIADSVCPTVDTWSEWNITDYVINQTRNGNDLFLQLKADSGFVPGGWYVGLASNEYTGSVGGKPYLQINLNPAVCGDGYCTALNETAQNCCQDCGACAPTNVTLYLNGTRAGRQYINGSYANFTVDINVTGLEVNLSTNMPGWVVQSGPAPLTNITQIICSQANTWYNITGFYEGNASYAPSSETFWVLCYFGSTLDLYLNGTDGDRGYSNGSYANFTVVSSASDIVNLTTNMTGWVNQGGSSPLQNISLILCNQDTTYNITAWGSFTGNSTHLRSFETHYLNCTSRRATKITLNLNNTHGNYYYLNGSYANFTVDINVTGLEVNLTTNITGWTEQSNVTTLENISRITCSSNNTWYNITGYWRGNDSYTSDSETFYAICYLESSDVNLTLNGTQGNYYYLNSSYANFTVVLNKGGVVNLTTNVPGWVNQVGNSPLENTSLISCSSNNTWYNITGYWAGNSTYLPSSETHYAICYFGSLDINLTLNNTQNNYYYLNDSYANFTVVLSENGIVNLTTNMTGWIDQGGNSPLQNISRITCSSNNTWYNITGYWRGNSTHVTSSKTYYAICYLNSTTLNLYLNGTDDNYYYLNGSYANFTVILNEGGIVNLTTNISGWAAQSGISPLYNTTQIVCSSNNTWYNITGWFTGNTTHLLSSETHYTICYLNPTTINLYLNGTDSNKEYQNGSYANFTVVLNEGGIVNLTTNMTGWVDQGGNSPLQNISYVSCSQNTTYNITGYWIGNSTYLPSSETHYVNCTVTTTTTTTTPSATTTTPGSGGGGGGGSGGVGKITTTSTIPITTTIQVENVAVTTVVTTTTLQVTTTPTKIPLQIGNLSNVWIILIVFAILVAVVLVTFMILHRKVFGGDVYEFNEESGSGANVTTQF